MMNLRNDRNLYVVKPAHINTDLEQAVEAHPEFEIVRKLAAR